MVSHSVCFHAVDALPETPLSFASSGIPADNPYGDPRDDAGLDWLDSLPYTTAFVLGNHENYDAYKGYPKEEWHGGQIQRIRPSVLHLMRGQVYELNGRKFFTMGGASSHDIQDGILEPDDPDFEEKFQQLEQRGALFRVNHRSWWAEELPSEAEYLEARANLERVHWNVDYIISHCCPSSIQDVFSGGMFKKDALTEFFDEVCQRCTFRYWFFGHYHSNMVIEKKYAMLYEQITKTEVRKRAVLTHGPFFVSCLHMALSVCQYGGSEMA